MRAIEHLEKHARVQEKNTQAPLDPSAARCSDRHGRHVAHPNSNGTPQTQDGFRAGWQTQVKRGIHAPLRRHRLVFRGLRKSAVVMLLEAGCTTAKSPRSPASRCRWWSTTPSKSANVTWSRC